MINRLLVLLFIVVISISCNSKTQTYTIETSVGNIKIKLYDNTPLHKENFEKLVAEQFYDSVLFHRIIPEFMIQTGNAETKKLPLEERPSGNGEPDYTIEAEFIPQNIHKRGALAAARVGGPANPEKRSSSSQFYIVQGRKYTEDELSDIEFSTDKIFTAVQRNIYKTLGGAPFLDRDYTVFGEVVEGMKIVDQIAAVPTAAGDYPRVDVRIIRITKD